MLKILVEYFYKHCRPRWDATELKSRTIHIDIICFCFFDLMLYVPCQQILSHAGMISCLPGSNQYQAADKVSCSCNHLHSESVGGESPTSSPSHISPVKRSPVWATSCAPISMSTDASFSSTIKDVIHQLNLEIKHMSQMTLRAILRGLFCCPILAKGLLFSIKQFWTHAHLDRFSSSDTGLLLPECDIDSTGLHYTSSRSDHAQNYFQMTKEVALTRLDILVDSILGHASLLTFCKLKILVEYFYTYCRPRWDATVLKVKDNPHRHNLFICLFI